MKQYKDSCQISIWALQDFSKILPRVVLGLLVFVKFYQTSIWVFGNSCQNRFGLCKVMPTQNLGFVKQVPNQYLDFIKIDAKLVFEICKIGTKLVFELYKNRCQISIQAL